MTGLLLALALTLALGGPLAAETWDCDGLPGSPAVLAPQCVDAVTGAASACGPASVGLWPPGIRPLRVLLDMTDRRSGIGHPGGGQYSEGYTRHCEVDGSKLWCTYNAGLRVFDLSSGGAQCAPPSRARDCPPIIASARGWPPSQWMTHPHPSEQLAFTYGLAVSGGVAMIASKTHVGPSVWSLGPLTRRLELHYQHPAGDGLHAELVTVPDRRIGVTMGEQGIDIYDVDAALALPAPCLDTGAECPGVHLGHLPGTYYGGDAVARGGDLWVIASALRADLWRLPGGDPTQAGLVWSAPADLRGWHAPVFVGDRLALASRNGRVRLYDPAPLFAGGDLAAPLWEGVVPSSWPVVHRTLTWSPPYLYAGVLGSAGMQGRAVEALWRLDPWPPVDVAAGRGIYTDPCHSGAVDYWSRSYAGNAWGLNDYQPSAAVVHDRRLFRAAGTVLEVHELPIVVPDEEPESPLIFRDGFESGGLGQWSHH